MLTDPKAKDRFADIGGAPLGGSAADFHKLITDEIAKWGKLIRRRVLGEIDGGNHMSAAFVDLGQ